MPNTNPYATGNNVYRGGSNVATMGQVDPMGYVTRELNNRRSQLAQGMLQNLGNSNAPQGSPFMVHPKNVSLLAIRALGNGGANVNPNDRIPQL
jgi:hypothetical protein